MKNKSLIYERSGQRLMVSYEQKRARDTKTGEGSS